MPAAKVLRALFDSLVHCKEEGGLFQFVEVAKLYRSLPASFTEKELAREVDTATTELIKQIGMKASEKDPTRIKLYTLLLEHDIKTPQLKYFEEKWPIAHAKDEERGKSFLIIKKRQGKQKQLGKNQDKATVRVVVRQNSILPANIEIKHAIQCGRKESLDGLLWMLHQWWKKDKPQHDTILVLNPYFYRASNIKSTRYSTGEFVWEPEAWGTVPAIIQSEVWVLYIDLGGSYLHIKSDSSKESHLKFGNRCIVTGTDTYLVKEINGVVRSSDWLERGYGNSLSISGEQGRFDWKGVLKKWNPRVAGDIFVSPESVPAEGILTSDSVLRRTGSTASSYHTAPGTPSRTSLVLKDPATEPEVPPTPAFNMVPSNSSTPARPSAAAPQPAMHKATQAATSPTPQPKKRGWMKWVKDFVGL